MNGEKIARKDKVESVPLENVVSENKTEAKKTVDTNTLFLLICLLYVTNMIDNRGLKRMMDIVERGAFPEDVVAFLVKEAAKVT